jgi:hypothetical protein
VKIKPREAAKVWDAGYSWRKLCLITSPLCHRAHKMPPPPCSAAACGWQNNKAALLAKYGGSQIKFACVYNHLAKQWARRRHARAAIFAGKSFAEFRPVCSYAWVCVWQATSNSSGQRACAIVQGRSMKYEFWPLANRQLQVFICVCCAHKWATGDCSVFVAMLTRRGKRF